MSWEAFLDFVTNDNVIRALRVVGVLLGAIVLSGLLRRSARRVETRVAAEGLSERHAQRGRTLARVLTSAGIVAIWVLAVLMTLGALEFDVGPLIAGLGITGVALGFGMQSLVRDVVTGFFILLEDQYAVGDIIEINKAASGTVEQLTLRITGLRDFDGTLHYVSNGNITHVSNRSKDWSVAVIDIKVPDDQDLARVRAIVDRLGHDAKTDPELGEQLLDAPRVLGIEALADKEVTLRLTAETKPGCQLMVGRALRARIKATFDAEGIDVHTA